MLGDDRERVLKASVPNVGETKWNCAMTIIRRGEKSKRLLIEAAAPSRETREQATRQIERRTIDS